MTMSGLMIEVEGLTKRFGQTTALAGVDFSVPRASILGVLGPNGAGKSTAIRILTTLSLPDAGRAAVAGFDVVRDADEVRRRIGVTAQDATLDELLTGRQNLRLVGRLSGLDRAKAKSRSAELLDRFELSGSADRILKSYSGGMRRRLDIAAGLMAEPAVLFLDEPTTGLDPQSRNTVWDAIRELVGEGVTVLLTTQYLEEADRLADEIVVIDRGRVIARGDAQTLKAATGGATLEVTLTRPDPVAEHRLLPFVVGPVQTSHDGRRLHAPATTSAGLATRVVRALDEARIEVDDVVVHQPSLDDVFLALTNGEERANADQLMTGASIQ
jgi:ABC-2 type transport system ATP-binding protein